MTTTTTTPAPTGGEGSTDVLTDHDAVDELGAAIGAFAERVVLASIGSFEMATIELGMRLGLYGGLATGPATPADLANRAGIAHRYAQEWLEQQASAGILTVDSEPSDGDPDRRTFALPDAVAACLLDPDSLAFVAPLATFAAAAPEVLGRLVEAYRHGTGISFGEYGDWIRRAQEAANRPQFMNLLASDWLPSMPDVTARLASGSARVADLGCGCGWSSIAIAAGFEGVAVDGFDSDDASVRAARENAASAGVGDRVSFHTADAAAGWSSTYDLVCCFEALHDMAHPVEALAAMKDMAGTDGVVFIVDERAGDVFTPDDPDPIQRFFYAASVLHCLPVGLSEHDSAATGTVMRTSTLERYASAAGFGSVEVLPVEHDMFRFYRLQP